MTEFNMKDTLEKKDNKIISVILMTIPFILMDLALRFFARGIHYFRPTALFPAISFTVIWITLIIGIVVMVGGIWGRIIYFTLFDIDYNNIIINCNYYLFLVKA